jgi:hypothetical protein
MSDQQQQLTQERSGDMSGTGNPVPDRIRVMNAETTAADIEPMTLVGLDKSQADHAYRNPARVDSSDSAGSVDINISQGGEGVKDSRAGRINVERGGNSATHGTSPAEDESNSYDEPPAPGLYEPKRDYIGRTEVVTDNQIKRLVIIGVIALLAMAQVGYFVASIVLSVRTGQVDGLKEFYSNVFDLLVPILLAAGGYAVGRHSARKARE